MTVKKALEEVRKGEFVLIRDSPDREDETDMVIPAESVKPQHVAQMREDAGGLICVAIHPKVADALSLPFLSEIYRSASGDHDILNSAKADDLPYDERSSFSISVNHRDTFTGITDKDRALTIKELGNLSREVLEGDSVPDFGERFRTPGHVPLLKAASGLVSERMGQTELSVSLLELSGVIPCAVVCEMLDTGSNNALSKSKARRYSMNNDMVFLEGDEIKEYYLQKKRGADRDG
ncbi:3,4-dihydroxy-2-butanone 4-phosphate synthase [candidate division MSBL1 archaeon SCGC-AAA259A05]|uniref:3,4-dihydroxy-2-butanone 4-phosphate synthase n=1 Tax=candidate division MSBL1 archaeon SCGC-AAA259A05 TaxID=1698259 RepID=A0A133U500_9EURY|nr:3,4-dihydroxy-2-butanone 4-phosphate synthase [candidate division MSBL1 archaeon SCGC-AAA259A05]